MAGGPLIPHQAPRAHLIHVDTCYARPILLNWDADRDILRAARKLTHRRDESPPPTIGEVALGEVFLTIARDAEDGLISLSIANDSSRRLVEALRHDQLRLCGFGAHSSGDALRISAELREEDNRLTFTDSLIAATALACEDCTSFYTNDPALLHCSPLLSRSHAKHMIVREAPS